MSRLQDIYLYRDELDIESFMLSPPLYVPNTLLYNVITSPESMVVTAGTRRVVVNLVGRFSSTL
jgi:hypothetical protein